MRTDELFQKCMDVVFQPHTQNCFLRDQIRDLGVDISRTENADATQLALTMVSVLGARLTGTLPPAAPMNNLAYHVLLSWYFPTDDQMMAAMGCGALTGHRVTSRRVTIEGMPNRFARHCVIATEDHFDHGGMEWPAGALIPMVKGDDRIRYLELSSISFLSLDQDSMRDNTVLIDRE